MLTLTIYHFNFELASCLNQDRNRDRPFYGPMRTVQSVDHNNRTMYAYIISRNMH